MSTSEFRIGHGYDVHGLIDGRPLVLGGVTIPYFRGLAGHSDADVLLHAVADAVLGAAGLGDIGRHFPPTDERWRGADSRDLLRQCLAMAQHQGWRVGNVDVTVAAQAPKLAPFVETMRANLARDLETGIDQTNIKATTTEGLGFAGRGEGIAAYAVCLLMRA